MKNIIIIVGYCVVSLIVVGETWGFGGTGFIISVRRRCVRHHQFSDVVKHSLRLQRSHKSYRGSLHSSKIIEETKEETTMTTTTIVDIGINLTHKAFRKHWKEVVMNEKIQEVRKEQIFSDITLIGQTPNLIISTKLPDKIYQEVLSFPAYPLQLVYRSYYPYIPES